MKRSLCLSRSQIEMLKEIGAAQKWMGRTFVTVYIEVSGKRHGSLEQIRIKEENQDGKRSS